MNKLPRKVPGKLFLFASVIFLLLFQGMGQEQELKRAKLYRDVFPLISDSDLYCSFTVVKKVEMDTQIIGSEKERERILIWEGDIFFIDKGGADGLEVGQVFLILETGKKIKKYGRLVFKRGRAQVVEVEDRRASLRLDKACGPVTIGNSLVPFEEKPGFLGRDLGFDIPVEEGEGLQGKIIYAIREHNLISGGQWALIDLGEEEGIQFGQQLVVFRKKSKKEPIKVLGNLIVIDVQRNTSTVKILSSKDAIELGDRVQPRF